MESNTVRNTYLDEMKKAFKHFDQVGNIFHNICIVASEYFERLIFCENVLNIKKKYVKVHVSQFRRK